MCLCPYISEDIVMCGERLSRILSPSFLPYQSKLSSLHLLTPIFSHTLQATEKYLEMPRLFYSFAIRFFVCKLSLRLPFWLELCHIVIQIPIFCTFGKKRETFLQCVKNCQKVLFSKMKFHLVFLIIFADRQGGPVNSSQDSKAQLGKYFVACMRNSDLSS